MSTKFLASEFSPKVKAYNTIEENILKHKLELYQKQEKTNLRMIEKDTKRYQEDFNEKLRVTKNNFLNQNDDYENEALGNSGNGHLSDQTHQKNLKNDKPRKRRKKKSTKRDKDKKLLTVTESITNETFLYKSATDGELDEIQKTRCYRSPCFLPKLPVANNSVDLVSAKPTKTTDYLSLPPIKNSGLTSSVSLPSLNMVGRK